MKFEFNKETLAKVGDGAWRLTKHIVKKGIQQTVMETAGSATLAALDGDMSKVKKQLEFDSIVGPKKVKTDKPKRKWFGKNKDEAEEVLEEIGTTIEPQEIEVDGQTVLLDENGDVVIK